MTWINEELRARNRAGGRVQLWWAEVIAVAELTPRMRRIRLAGEGLRGFGAGMLPADSFKVVLPAPGHAELPELEYGRQGVRVARGATPPLYRAYTVRRFDPETTELDVDVLVHGADEDPDAEIRAPGARWAAHARPGDPVALVGPKAEFHAAEEADWHLLLGDETALPAIAAVLESLPARTPVRVLAEVGEASDELVLNTAADADVTWLHRDAPAGASTVLEDAVRELAWWQGEPQVWGAAEAEVIRRVRRHLSAHGVRRHAMHVVGYWRRGNAG